MLFFENVTYHTISEQFSGGLWPPPIPPEIGACISKRKRPNSNI